MLCRFNWEICEHRAVCTCVFFVRARRLKNTFQFGAFGSVATQAKVEGNEDNECKRAVKYDIF